MTASALIAVNSGITAAEGLAVETHRLLVWPEHWPSFSAENQAGRCLIEGAAFEGGRVLVHLGELEAAAKSIDVEFAMRVVDLGDADQWRSKKIRPGVNDWEAVIKFRDLDIAGLALLASADTANMKATKGRQNGRRGMPRGHKRRYLSTSPRIPAGK